MILSNFFEKLKHFQHNLSLNIYLIALFMAFLSASTQMLYSYLAVSLKYNLDISLSELTIIDGTVEFFSYFVRIFSGAISDYLYDRKLLLIIGCSIATLIKPVFAFANSTFSVVISEIIERFGSGIQASPRDALIADVSNPNKLGTSFGFCRSMKTIGGVIGAGIAVAIMYFSKNDYKLLFCLASIPAFLALLCVIGIRKPVYTNIKKNQNDKTNKNKKFDNPFQKKYLKSLDSKFWKLIIFAFACELGHFAESLLTIKSTQILSKDFCGITSIFAMLGQIFFAYFVGMKSDNYNKLYILRGNLLLLLLSYLAMNSIESSAIIFLSGIFLFYGQFAITQIIFLSVINKNVSLNLRATAIGIFYVALGVSYMLTAKICGMLCEDYGYDAAFKYVIMIISVLVIKSNFMNEKYYR